MTDDTAADDFVDAPEGDALEELRAENAQLRDQALRYAAEAENTRRRAERDSNDARAFAIQKFARDLLGVADNFSRALQHAPQDAADPTVRNFVLGIELTEKELAGAFERNGLKKVDPARGARFDPHLHQAMTEQPAEDVPAGAVVSVMQPGYELFGRIVRPALVVTAPKAAGSSMPDETPRPAAESSPRGYASEPADDSGRAYDGKV